MWSVSNIALTTTIAYVDHYVPGLSEPHESAEQQQNNYSY